MSGSPLRRMLVPQVVRHRWALAGAGGATVFTTVAQLAQPWPLKLVVDRLAAGHPGSDAADVLFLAGLAVLVVALAAAGAVASYLSDVWMNRAGERIVHELRVAVYAHLQRLSLSFHRQRSTGDLVTRVTGDVSSIGTFFTDSLGTVVSAVLLLAGMAAVTLVLDPLLALATFATAPVLAIVTFRFRRRLTTLARDQRLEEGRIASMATEALEAAPVVKAFGSEEYEEGRIASTSETRRLLGVESARTEARFSGIVDTLGAVSAALVLVAGVYRVRSGALTPGDLVVFAAYAQKTYRPLRDIARQAGKIARAVARGERLAEILATDERLATVPGPAPAGRATGHLRLRAVSFGYRDERNAVESVDLEIPAGTTVAVVGTSGAGKSSLASLVARFHDPGSGTVELDGVDIRRVPLPWLREQVGLLLQDTVLFSGTIAENIAYAVEATRAAVVEAARAAQADRFVEALPDGYDTILNAGTGLSGGQRQRIGIARVLLRDPAVLVLDEPTTGLDAASENELVASLADLMRGRTVLLVTHSMALAAKADRIVVMEGGRVVEDGTPSDLLAGRGRFHDFCRRQGFVAGDRRRTTGRAWPPRHVLPPAAVALLDEEAVADSVERTLGTPPVDGVAIRQVELRPRATLDVVYDVEAAGERFRVAAFAGAARLTGVPSRGRARPQAPVARCVGFDAETGAVLGCVPFDASMPILTEPAHLLADVLREAGAVVAPTAEEPVLMAYRPRRSGVLRVSGHVLKAYASRSAAERSHRGLAFASAHALGPGPAGQLLAMSATVEHAADGVPVARAEATEVGLDAGRLLRRLQRLPAHGLPVVDASVRLAGASAAAEAAAAVHPTLAPRLEAIVRELGRRLPVDRRLVPAHGDFDASQLVRRDAGLAAVDFDTLCSASPSLDPATYAASLMRGRDGDAARVQAALREVVGGLGETPADLDWHLAAAMLLRTRSPFRLWKKQWPERMDGIVEACEGVLFAGAVT